MDEVERYRMVIIQLVYTPEEWFAIIVVIQNYCAGPHKYRS